jgi:hypothetical protein
MTVEEAFKVTNNFIAETRLRELDKDGNIVPFDNGDNCIEQHGSPWNAR